MIKPLIIMVVMPAAGSEDRKGMDLPSLMNVLDAYKSNNDLSDISGILSCPLRAGCAG